jgi:GDP-D-mannose dehydratase
MLKGCGFLALIDVSGFHQASTSELFGLVRNPQTEKTVSSPITPRRRKTVCLLIWYHREAYGMYRL